MPGSKSDYLEKKLLDLVFSNTAFSVPTLAIGLWTVTLDDTSTGATAGEPSGNAYARVAPTQNTTNWPAATGSGAGGSSKSNGAAITFPTATGSWGTVTYFGACDSSTTAAGNMLYYGSLTTSKTISNGDTASFAVGQLTFTED